MADERFVKLSHLSPEEFEEYLEDNDDELNYDSWFEENWENLFLVVLALPTEARGLAQYAYKRWHFDSYASIFSCLRELADAVEDLINVAYPK